MQIFVLGMHRSGTSAVARILNLMGCYFGVEDAGTAASEENPKGFWERKDVRQLNDAILRNAGFDWDRMAHFDVGDLTEGDRAVYQEAVREVVFRLDGHRPWFIKEPRCCLTFDLWRSCLETPACVIAFRHPLDVARSLERRNAMPLETGLALWEAYNVSALGASEGVPRAVVSYDALMADPRETVRRVAAAFKGAGYALRQPSGGELAAFLEDELHHFSADEADRDLLTTNQAALLDALQQAVDTGDDVAGTYTIDAASTAQLEAYEQTLPSVGRRAADANTSLMRRQRVDTSTELALKRLELAKALESLDQAASEVQDLRRELDGEKFRMLKELGGTEETLRRKDRELIAATETIRDLHKELADLRVTNRALLTSSDTKDRDLLYATDALAELQTLIEGLQESVRGKDRDLTQATEEIRTLQGERSRLEAAARTERTRIAELEGVRDELIGGVELLVQSRRWRLGDTALSLPHRLLGRPRPQTVADHLLKLPDATPGGRAGASTRRSGGSAATAMSGKLTTVLVLAWDVGHNPLGRAYLLAEALARKYTVVLAGFQFPRYGDAVWKPLRDAPFDTIAIPGRPFPDFQRTVEHLARRVDADVVLACKARLPSVQTGLMCKAARNRPLIVDVDDYELGFFSNRAPLDDLATADADALAEPFEETWTRYTENLLPWADGLLVSNAALQRRFGGVIVPHARDETVFDPQRVDRAAARRALGLEDDVRTVVFVGTPRPHKGVVEVLDAVKAADREDFRFVVVGTPPDRAFENELRERGGETLQLVPDQPFDRLAEITAAADLVCLLQDPETEIAKYQLPAKVVDAIAMGVPVLATDVPPLADLIRAGAVEAVTRKALPERIAAWLDAPADARAAQAERARNAFRESYSFDAILRTLSAEIERCVAAPKPLPAEANAFLASQAERYRETAAAPDEGLDLVMFWKQGDVGLYGRRFDMLVEALAQRGDVRRIAVFDAPFTVHQVLRDHMADVTVHHREVAEAKLIRRWGLADTDRVSHHVFLFDSRRGQDRYPPQSAFADFVAAELDGVGIDPAEAVFWFYPALEHYDALAARFRPRLRVADVVDDQRTWPERTTQEREDLTRHYRTVVEDADVVLANCEAVRDAMSAFGRHVALVPNGCDTAPPPPEPEGPAFRRFRDLPRPVLGLVGNLEGKTDRELLDRLARERPAYQIALIGSTHTNADMLRLDELPNVHFFGVVRYPEVKAWIGRFDAALVPHLDTEQTRSMHPLKMLVYAACGVRVVSTRIDNLGEFEPFIRVAADHEEFLQGVDDAVSGAFEVDVEGLAAVVERNSWKRRAEEIAGLVHGALGGGD